MKKPIREQLKVAYNSLLEGQKKRAAEVHGCEMTNFVKIVNGRREVKDDTIILQMIQSIKQASKDILIDAKESNKKIQVIAKRNPIKK